jgi:hypothetical protein
MVTPSVNICMCVPSYTHDQFMCTTYICSIREINCIIICIKYIMCTPERHLNATLNWVNIWTGMIHTYGGKSRGDALDAAWRFSSRHRGRRDRDVWRCGSSRTVHYMSCIILYLIRAAYSGKVHAITCPKPTLLILSLSGGKE